MLMARIDRLPDEVKHTLRVASVIGRQFPVKVLERVLAGGPEARGPEARGPEAGGPEARGLAE